MALPTNLQRPSIPYTPEQVGAYNDRYASLGKIPPSGDALDGDVLFLLDNLNIANDAINGVTAGILPGANEEINKNKLPTTDGEGNISWTLLQNDNMDDNCCDTRNYLNGSVTPEKLQAIPGSKLTSNSVDDSKIIALNGGKLTDGTVIDAKINDLNGSKLINNTVSDSKISGMSGAKLTAGTVPDAAIIGMNGSKLTNLSVPTAALAATSVTIDKINSGASAAGTVLTSLAGNTATFAPIPSIGKILQIQNYTTRSITSQATSGNFSSFDTPFRVSITTLGANSNILIYVCANVAASSNFWPVLTLTALYKNGSIWEQYIGGAGGILQTLQQVSIEDSNSIGSINALCLDEGVGNIGTTNTYELRVFSGAWQQGYGSYLNRSQQDQGSRTVSSIYAIEIGTQ